MNEERAARLDRLVEIRRLLERDLDRKPRKPKREQLQAQLEALAFAIQAVEAWQPFEIKLFDSTGLELARRLRRDVPMAAGATFRLPIVCADGFGARTFALSTEYDPDGCLVAREVER